MLSDGMNGAGVWTGARLWALKPPHELCYVLPSLVLFFFVMGPPSHAWRSSTPVLWIGPAFSCCGVISEMARPLLL